MLKCLLASDWHISYHNDVLHIKHEPKAFGDLEIFYQNPSYYSSWYLRNMHENLGLNG